MNQPKLGQAQLETREVSGPSKEETTATNNNIRITKNTKYHHNCKSKPDRLRQRTPRRQKEIT